MGQDSWHTQGLCLALLESDHSEIALWCRAVECHQDNGSEVVFLIPSSLVRACDILRGQREWQTWSGVPTGDPDYDIITAESKVGLSNSSRCWSKSRGQVGWGPFHHQQKLEKDTEAREPSSCGHVVSSESFPLCTHVFWKKEKRRGKGKEVLKDSALCQSEWIKTEIITCKRKNMTRKKQHHKMEYSRMCVLGLKSWIQIYKRKIYILVSLSCRVC